MNGGGLLANLEVTAGARTSCVLQPDGYKGGGESMDNVQSLPSLASFCMVSFASSLSYQSASPTCPRPRQIKSYYSRWGSSYKS